MGALSQCFKGKKDADKYIEQDAVPYAQTPGIPVLSQDMISAVCTSSFRDFVVAQERLLVYYHNYAPSAQTEASESIFAIEWHLDRLYSSGRTVTVSNDSLETQGTLAGHTRPVKAMAPYSNRLVTGSADYSLKLWDIEALTELNSQTINWNVVTSLKHVAASESIVHCSEDLRLRVWDVRSSALHKVVEWHAGDNIVNSCDVADPYIITGHRGFNSKGSELKLWDRRKNELVVSMERHAEPICKVICHEDFVYSCGKDGYLAKSDLSTLALDSYWQHPLAKPFVTMTMLDSKLLTANIEPRLKQFGTNPQLLIELS
jgi:WD40 repeat protein